MQKVLSMGANRNAARACLPYMYMCISLRHTRSGIHSHALRSRNSVKHDQSIIKQPSKYTCITRIVSK